MHFLSYLLVPSLVSAVAIRQRDTRPRALYALSDDPAGTNVLAMQINIADGSLSDPVLIPTGGFGRQGINITSGIVSDQDPLFTQDALTVADNYLFATNTGSNSLSLFRINPDDPTDLLLLDTVSTLGTFPSTVTYHSSLKTACVANSGSKPGIACFSVDHVKGLTPITPLLPINITQTDPPVGPFSTVSDINFSPSGKYVMATVKGPAANATGSFYIWPVVNGTISSTPVISQVPSVFSFFIFGFSFLSDSKAYITDVGFGGALVSISPSFKISVLDKTVVPNQQFTCWTSYAPRFDSMFLADAGSTNVTIVDPTTGALKGFVAQDESGIGNYAIAVDRNYLYVTKISPTFMVSDLTSLNNVHAKTEGLPISAQFQTLDFSDIVERPFISGLSVYPYTDPADESPAC